VISSWGHFFLSTTRQGGNSIDARYIRHKADDFLLRMMLGLHPSIVLHGRMRQHRWLQQQLALVAIAEAAGLGPTAVGAQDLSSVRQKSTANE